MVDRHVPIDPPVFTAVEPYGLFAAAPVLEPMPTDQAAGIVYEFRCSAGAAAAPAGCIPAGGKQIPAEAPQLWHFDPFAVYAFEPCLPTSFSESVQRQAARDLLLRGEQHVVESVLWGQAVPGDLGLDSPDRPAVELPAASDLTDAVALLEWYAGTQDGAGVIHANVGLTAAAVRRRLARLDGNVYRSPAGHVWAFGGGYPFTGPGGAAPQPQHAYLSWSRPVTVRRTEVMLQTGRTYQQNLMYSRAERVYVVDVPCAVAWTQAPIFGDGPDPVTLPPAVLTASVDPDQGTAPLTVTLTTTRTPDGPTAVTWGDEDA